MGSRIWACYKTEEDYKWDESLKDLSEEFPGFNIPGLLGTVLTHHYL